MFNYITEVEFLSDDTEQNISDNEKASQTIQTLKNIYDKVDTGNKTVNVMIRGTVERHGIISGLKFELRNQLDKELVRRFENVPLAK